MDILPKRKDIRLKNYDYSQAGYYFLTICTKDRCKLLSDIVGGGFHAAPKIELTPIGNAIMESIDFISNQSPDVKVDKYIIMPNHIHLLIILQGQNLDRHGNPPLHKIVGQLKSYTNKRYNELNKTKDLILWQRNYYEHIIRSQQEYEEIYEYIEINPIKWEEDKYYI